MGSGEHASIDKRKAAATSVEVYFMRKTCQRVFAKKSMLDLVDSNKCFDQGFGRIDLGIDYKYPQLDLLRYMFLIRDHMKLSIANLALVVAIFYSGQSLAYCYDYYSSTNGGPRTYTGTLCTGDNDSDFGGFVGGGGNFNYFEPGGGGGGRGGATERAPSDADTVADPESCENPATAMPVIIQTGNKILPQSDFNGEGQMSLALERTYSKAFDRTNPPFGKRWASSIDYSLQFNYSDGSSCTYIPGGSEVGCSTSNISSIYAWRPSGERFTYTWNAAAGKYLTSNAKPRPNIVRSGVYWLMTREDNAIERYSDIGAPYSVTDEYGVGWYFYYNGPYLKNVTHSSGRAMQFTWSDGKVSTATDSAGNSYSYSYNANGYLSGVTRPVSATQSEAITYHYENSTFPDGLTGVSYNGIRYSRAQYNAVGKVLESGLEGGDEKSSFIYTANTTKVTNAKGAPTTFTYTTVGGGRRLTNVTRTGVTNCPSSATAYTYDTNGFKKTATDPVGRVTNYVYDADGLLLSKEQGSNAYKEVNVWDTNLKKISNQKIYLNGALNSETVYEYYPAGNAAERRIKSVSVYNRSANGQANQLRKTNYSYTVGSNKLLLQMVVDGPISGTSDTTTYNFNSTGDLVSVVNALGHTMTRSNFDGNGRARSVVDPNNVLTSISYDRRGRVSSTTRNGLATSYSYTPLDQIASVTTTPSGVLETYTYNGIGRLIQVRDINDNNQFFEYDKLGNVTKLTLKRGTNTQFYAESDYDEAGRRVAFRAGGNQQLVYAYNAADELTSVTDALNRVTRYDYDAMGQQKTVTAPDSSTVVTTRDGLGQVLSYKDYRNLTTTYKYDGFGNLINVVSPDAGSTLISYREDGKPTSAFRNSSIAAYYSHDLLGRITQRSLNSLIEKYSYDSCANGRGRLCSLTDSSGSTAYVYDSNGLVKTKTATIMGLTYKTTWAYDTLSRLTDLTYPSGNKVTYRYSGDEVNSISASVNGGDPQSIAANIVLRADGQMGRLNVGTGQLRTYLHDSGGRVTAIQSTGGLPLSGGIQNLTYGYDAAGQISQIGNLINKAAAQTLIYDARSRVNRMTSKLGNQIWTYDANNNWATHSVPQLPIENGNYAVDSFSLKFNSNQLSYQTDGSLLNVNRAYLYDGRGNLTERQSGSVDDVYGYDAFDRMVTARQRIPLAALDSQQGLSQTSYRYNALNHRVSKSGLAGVKHFSYDDQGHLLSETPALDLDSTLNDGLTPVLGSLSGQMAPTNLTAPINLPTDYVWLNGQVVGLIRGPAVYILHNDHLGRPEVAATRDGLEVWRANNLPYDRRVTKDLIGGLNLGFPGQYHDQETGLWYNLNRYYDAETGRYTQADPIGLAGGSNPYSYVGGNPVSFVDPLGLEAASVAVRSAASLGQAGFTPPDYAFISISGLGMMYGGAIDRWGNTYVSPPGAGAYKSSFGAKNYLPSISVGVGVLADDCSKGNDREQAVQNHLSGLSYQGLLGGIGAAYAPQNGSLSLLLGVGTGGSGAVMLGPY